MSEEKLMKSVSFYFPKFQYEKLRNISKNRKIPMARLIALLIDDELIKDTPFTYDLTLAGEESVEYAYADEAGKLLNFLKIHDRPVGLDVLTMLRYHIGIPDKITFLGAFNECLTKDMIEPYKEKLPSNRRPMADDYYCYRIKGEGKTKKKKTIDKEAKEFQQYQKLHKKFKGVE